MPARTRCGEAMEHFLPIIGTDEFTLADVAGQIDAVGRSSVMTCAPKDLKVTLHPGADNSPDKLVSRLVVDCEIGTPTPGVDLFGNPEILVPLADGRNVRFCSLFHTRWTPYLEHFPEPGIKMLVEGDFSHLPDLYAEEWITLEEFDLTESSGYFEIYPINKWMEGAPPRPWEPDSLSFDLRAEKVNNCPARGQFYANGKFAHKPAPLFTAWNPDGIFVGKTIGRLVLINGGLGYAKQYRAADLIALREAGATRWGSDATLGCTTKPASTLTYQMSIGWNKIYTATEDGTVESFSFCFSSDTGSGGSPVYLGLYSSGSLISNGGTPLLTSVNGWGTVNYSVKPNILLNNSYKFGVFISDSTKTLRAHYQYTSGYSDLKYKIPSSQYATAPSNWNDLTQTDPNSTMFGFYITYNLAGGLLKNPGLTGGMQVLVGGMRG